MAALYIGLFRREGTLFITLERLLGPTARRKHSAYAQHVLTLI